MKSDPTFNARRPRATRGSRLFWTLICLSLLMLALPALSITLISGGSTSYVIAKQTGCDTTTSQAATDIQTYLRTISGGTVTIPINSYADISTVPTNAIVIGNLTTSPTLALEQIEMKVSGQRLILRGGSSTAHRYAVFGFLEDYIGCRFYSPTVEYLPSLNPVTVSDSYNVTQSPSFEMRYLYQQDVTTNATWCVKNRVNGAVTIDGTHNMYTAVPPATYFASHPEYYPLHSGARGYNTTNQWLCFTNPDLPAIIASYVNGRMAATGANVLVNIAQGDWYDSCECATCQAAYTAEGSSWSGVMLGCLNAAADIVAQSYPTRRMMTFAYMHTEKPGATAPRANLMIRLCHWTRCDIHGIDECDDQNVFETNMANWQNLTTPEQLYIWDYGTNYDSGISPWPNVYALIPNMQYYYNHEARGIFYQGVYWAKGGDLSWLKMWMLAKVLWNKDVNATTVLNDFTNGYYGAAADEMRAYIDLLEDRGRDAALNWHPDTIFVTLDEVRAKLLPDSILNQADSLYDAAEAAGLTVSQTLYDRVHYDRAGLLYTHIYNKKQLARITSPATRLVKLGDNAYYDWKDAFYAVIGDRGCGNEYRSGTRALLDLKPQQAGDLVSIENTAVKIEVCPWVEGSVTALTDKLTGRQILMPANLNLDATNYPFNGYYNLATLNSGGTAYARVAADSATVTTDGDGTQHLVIVTDMGVGNWSPSVPTHRITREFILPPGSAASFTEAVKMKNIYTSTYSNEKLQGRLSLGNNADYSITATLPDNSTQAITTFPTTLDVKRLDFDNTRYGFRLSAAFSTSLPTTNATLSKNGNYTFNAIYAAFNSGTYSLTPNAEADVLNIAWSLSAITPTPTTAIDVVWKDHVKTTADYTFGSHLYKTTGLTANWDADAVSQKLLSGDCYVEWIFGTKTSQYTVGLTEINPNASLSNIKYGIRTSTGGQYRAYENNAWKGTGLITFSSDYDVMRIERVGTTVYYKCNGVTFYTSTVASTAPLMVDCSIYTAGEKYGIYNCRMSAATYLDAPTTAITAPTPGTVFPVGPAITINATATPPSGSTITKVEFYRAGTTKLGEDTTSPYSYTWASPTVGSHNLTVRAISSNGANTTSVPPVSIQVANALPTVTLTAPTNGAVMLGSSLTLTATASDADGTISKVEFYDGTTKLGEDTTSPYSYPWSGIMAGSHSLIARAIDDDAGSTDSSAAVITVWNNQDIGTPPTAGSASYDSGTSVFTVTGGGVGFSTTADAFHFAYIPVTGDCTIVARILTCDSNGSHPAAQGGVVIRESLAPGAKEMTLMHRKNGYLWYQSHYRVTTDGAISSPYVTAAALPAWLKVVRSGSTMLSYYSSNGTDWTQHQSRTITMGSTAYVGLAMTEQRAQTGTRTATFDNVSITTP